VEREVETWLRSYGTAWEQADAGLVAALFSDDATYRSHIFKGTSSRPGRSAAIEYWATLVEDGVPSTLAGCDILLSEDDGLVTQQHEYWHLQEGVLDPPSHWGWISPG
jgi:hypothetical protein